MFYKMLASKMVSIGTFFVLNAVKLLNKLMDMKLIEWTGTKKTDSYGKYIINNLK